MDPEEISIKQEVMPNPDIKSDADSPAANDYGQLKKEQCDVCTKLLSQVISTVTALGHQKTTTDHEHINNLNSYILDVTIEQMNALKMHTEAAHGIKSCQFGNSAITVLHEEKKDFSSIVCSKSLGQESVLARLIKKTHETIREHCCHICGKSFRNNSTMERHFKHVHEKIKDYSCPFCKKQFVRKSYQKIHIETIHKKMTDFLCAVCIKSFGQ